MNEKWLMYRPSTAAPPRPHKTRATDDVLPVRSIAEPQRLNVAPMAMQSLTKLIPAADAGTTPPGNNTHRNQSIC